MSTSAGASGDSPSPRRPATSNPDGRSSDVPANTNGDRGSEAGRNQPDSNQQDRNGERNGDRREVVQREKDQFGGMKFGSAFFGWLTATGTLVLLSALATALGVALIANNNGNADEETMGIAGVVVLLVILLIAYYCGGYVAGRMARFNGLRQGIAVWLWAVVIAVVVAVLGALAGDRFNVLAQVNAFPQIPLLNGDATATAIISAVAAAVVALIGAILGGLAGMRFHRRVDRAGLGD